jgi:hypothetical protein
MTKQIIALVALLSLGAFSAVYAEESVVQVPFEYHGQSCWLESDTIYQCTWQGEIEPFSLEDLEKYAHILTEEQYAEEYDRLTAVPEVVEEKAKLTPNELIIQEIENKLNSGVATATESVYMNLLKKLDTCQQGMDKQTAPIQNAREFEISEFTQWKVNNVKYDGKLGEIVMAIEECRAQHALKNVVGDGYVSMPTGDDDYQYSLLTELEGIQALDFELYNKNSKRIDMNGVCNNNQYDWKNRIMMGCEDTRVYDGTLHKGTSGKITYFSGTIGEYNEYLQNNSRYATTEDKKIQEQIAQPVLQEMLEENPWHNRE